jgi:GH24 family phage-related lysozyme (muramidase)
MYRLLLLVAWILPSYFSGAVQDYEPTRTYDLPCYQVEQMERMVAFARAMDILVAVEGYQETAKWDVNAYRCGYGTPCGHNYTTTRSEARADAVKALQQRADAVRRLYPNMNESAIAALAVMRYNVGNFGQDLDAAIRSGDLATISMQMLRYTKSEGKHLEGLRKRRRLEISLLLNNV